ncbi:hypothetical protein LJC44_01390 [Parabacteroides sp. OttesenSCG-928-G06]|nr:hypothetical protein [Parabacteroides sp. OttesenSCG-928-K15]MDL2281757.1 hypothetical protein [Parabacteroides sp. OttesenSCG-928-G06]
MIKFLILFFTLLFLSCQSQNDRLAYSLDHSSSNRPELERVLAYYKDNSQKWAAAEFLIENMPYHFGKEGGYISSRGEKLRPDPACFASQEEQRA